MTEFDRMTEIIEIVAKQMADVMFSAGCDDCPADTGKCDVMTCTDAWIAWLRREVEKWKLS